MITKFKVGKNIVAHTFEKDGVYMWSEGSPYKNKNKIGYSHKFQDVAFIGALIYAKQYAKHIGRHIVIVEYSDKKRTIYSV